MNVLFICSRNKLRSPTAEIVFSEVEGIEALSAGTNHDADTPLTGDLIEWADVVLVMESAHRAKVTARYSTRLKGKRLAVLAIPDRFEFMQPELVSLLKAKVPKYLRK